MPKLTEDAIRQFVGHDFEVIKNVHYSIIKENKIYTYFGDNRVVIELSNIPNKFTATCSCRKPGLEPWCTHIISALLHCSQKPEQVLTEQTLKNEVRKLSPLQMEEVLLRVANKNAELVLGEIDAILKPMSVTKVTKESGIKKRGKQANKIYRRDNTC